MEIKGQRVRHKTLGLGSISSFADSRIIVKFDTRPTESTFVFPDAFNNHLSFVDAALQNQVNALLAAKSKLPEKSMPKAAAATKNKTNQTVVNSNPSAVVKEQPKSRIAEVKPSQLPDAPGVYVIKNYDSDETLYVGRTKNLRQRIYSNHLHGPLSNARLKKYLIEDPNEPSITDLAAAKKYLNAD